MLHTAFTQPLLGGEGVDALNLILGKIAFTKFHSA
jgi:hypothetical protein